MENEHSHLLSTTNLKFPIHLIYKFLAYGKTPKNLKRMVTIRGRKYSTNTGPGFKLTNFML